MSGDVGAEVAAVLDERLRALYGADFVFDSDAKYLLGALAPLIDERVEAAKAEVWDEGLAASYVYPEPQNPYRAALDPEATP